MTPEQLFSYANMLALTGWVSLALSPVWRTADRFIVGIVVMLLSALYVYLIVAHFHPADFKSFGTLDGVARLFSSKAVLLAGWVHYLAFDLMAGLFIVRNARRHAIPQLLALVCAFGAFMLGPAGLLLYIIIRTIKTRRYFAPND